MNLIQRPRRLRGSETLRKMVRETRIDKSSLIYPLFVKDGQNIEEEIPSMEGQFRYSVDRLPYELERLTKAGVSSIMLFGIPDHKDEVGSGAYDENGIVQRALREARKQFPDLYYITDVCMCEYTSHGHCGLIKENDDTDDGVEILNDESLEYLAKVAVSYAKAGVDIVAPSDMMDGRVDAIRTALDENGFYNVMIMSYSSKYASAFYEPFRAAADSSPTHGNRKSYQMDPANALEAIRECELDVIEGADFLMVKPALPYLDIIKTIREEFTLPLVSYNVSGEYSMIMAAIEKGFLTENAILESLISIKRAGSDLIITNFASYVLLNDLL